MPLWGSSVEQTQTRKELVSLEDRVGTSQVEMSGKKRQRKLLEHPKMSKDITGIPEEEENKNRKEIFDVMTSEEDLKLMIVTKSQVQEAPTRPNKINMKTLHPGIRYSEDRKTKTKEYILKSKNQGHLIYRRLKHTHTHTHTHKQEESGMRYLKS